jgi:hypothetical protein
LHYLVPGRWVLASCLSTSPYQQHQLQRHQQQQQQQQYQQVLSSLSFFFRLFLTPGFLCLHSTSLGNPADRFLEFSHRV